LLENNLVYAKYHKKKKKLSEVQQQIFLDIDALVAETSEPLLSPMMS